MAYITPELIQRLKFAVPVETLVGQYAELHVKGRDLICPCPFLEHNDKTPSFRISPEKGMFYCFGCKKGGDSFKFLQYMEGLSFVEAVKQIATIAGIAVDVSSEPSVVDELRALNAKAAELFSFALRGVLQEDNYLCKRNLTDRTILDFKLGYDAGIHPGMLEKDYDECVVKECGLWGKSTPSRFFGRVVIPFMDENSRVVGFSGTGEGVEPKYLNTPDNLVFKKSKFLFGLPQAKEKMKETGCAILVEGLFDCMSMHQAGFRNTLAAGGSSFGAAQAKLLKRFVNTVIVLFDTDKAGKDAVRGAFVALFEQGIEVWVCRLVPEVKDPDELLQKFGVDGMLAALRGSQSCVPWLEHEFPNVDDVLLRSRYIKQAKIVANEFTAPESASLFLNLASQHLGIPESLIYNKVLGAKKKTVESMPSLMRSNANEMLLLACLLKQPKRKDITADLFSDSVKPFYDHIISVNGDAQLLYNNLETDEAEIISRLLYMADEGVSIESVCRSVRKEQTALRIEAILEKIRCDEVQGKDVSPLRQTLQQLLTLKESYR